MISECSDKASLLDLLSDADDGFVYMFGSGAADEKLNKAIDPEYDPDSPPNPDPSSDEVMPADKSGSSPYTVYYTWLTDCGYLFEDGAED